MTLITEVLRGIWEMRSAEDSAWFRAPANDMAILIHRTNAKPPAAPKFWMRRTFEAPGDSLTTFRYLHAAVTQIHRALNPPPEVTVNGMACPRVAENVTWSYCYDVGRALRPGRNEIAVQTWGSNLPGYFFLNAAPLRGYLDMTPSENERFFEAIEFSTALRIRLIEGNLRAIRSVDPERPIKLMAIPERMAINISWSIFDSKNGLIILLGIMPMMVSSNDMFISVETVAFTAAVSADITTAPPGLKR